MLSRISLDLRSLDLQPLLYFSNSPHEWQVESIGKVDEIVLFSWPRQDIDCPVCKRNCFDRLTVRS